MEIERAEFRALEADVNDVNNNIVRLQEQVKTLENSVKDLVSKAEFAPVKMIAYGLATAVLSSVIMAVLAKVIIK